MLENDQGYHTLDAPEDVTTSDMGVEGGKPNFMQAMLAKARGALNGGLNKRN